MVAIGRRIAGARIAAGLSISELARTIGVSEGTVRSYETGRAMPPLPRLEAIAAATERPLAHLIGESEAPGGNGGGTPTGDLATEARALRLRLEALEQAARSASPDAPELPIDELQSRGIELSPQEVDWLRQYDGAPCDSLAKAVDLVLLWRGWELRDKLQG